MKEQPLVSICCITYNHEPYIRQCLDGFVMQKTNFKFEVLIHDDASTDKTIDIINEYEAKYPQIIKSYIQKENQYSKGRGFVGLDINIGRAKGKYIAMCEGDDYWIDPLKLQKQVDFLENNPEYGLVYGDTRYYVFEKKLFKGNIGLIAAKRRSYDTSDRQDMFYRISSGKYGPISTLTTMFRKDLYDKIIPNNRKFRMGDTTLWLDLSQMARIKYIDDVFGVYVQHQGSATRENNILDRCLFKLSSCDMRIYYCYKYGYKIQKKLINRYKFAYIALVLNGGNPDLLGEEVLQDKELKKRVQLLKTSSIYRKYMQYLWKVLSYLNIIKIRIKMVFLLIDNFIWKIYKCRHKN